MELLKSSELYTKTCSECKKVFRTDKPKVRLCPNCKKKKQQEGYEQLKKPVCEEYTGSGTNADIFKEVREMEEYNRKHGTNYTYGQYISKFKAPKVIIKKKGKR